MGYNSYKKGKKQGDSGLVLNLNGIDGRLFRFILEFTFAKAKQD